MSRKPYPSDISDEEWSFIAPYLSLMRNEAPQRTPDIREIFNALRWLARAGAPWRMSPNDFPPWAGLSAVSPAVPIPLRNARKLISLIDAGVLATVALGYHGKQTSPPRFADHASTIKPDLVIYSHGQNYDLNKHPSVLIRHLLERQEVVAYSEDGYRTGGIGASEASRFQVLNNTAGRSERSMHLYSFGPITQYWQNQNNFAAAFVSAAQLVAQDWLASAIRQAEAA